MRQPYQVLIIPFRKKNNKIEYLIAKRSDMDIWQAFSGGGEEDETIIETAKREFKEEAGLNSNRWIELDSQCMLPKTMFEDNEKWTEYPYVIPEYSFGVEINSNPRLSDEHKEYKWCSYEEAYETLEFDSNKITLWELNKRLI